MTQKTHASAATEITARIERVLKISITGHPCIEAEKAKLVEGINVRVALKPTEENESKIFLIPNSSFEGEFRLVYDPAVLKTWLLVKVTETTEDDQGVRAWKEGSPKELVVGTGYLNM